MRGEIGLGRELGLGLGLSTQSYTSSVSISYDNVRQVYVGEMWSRSGIYRVEGPDRGSVDTDLEQLARTEYNAMMREISSKSKQDFGSDIGRAVLFHGRSAHVTRHKVDGVPVLLLASGGNKQERHKGGHGLKDLMTIAELAHTIYSAIHGDWFEALFSGMLLAFEDAHAKKGDKPKQIFAAEFGGVIITATSRALLIKKLLLQKNRRVQIIMNHMREHDLAREEARAEDGYIGSYLARRIIAKHRAAQVDWNKRVSPQGQETGWRARSLNMRREVDKRRNAAQAMWSERVL
jgi:hypothetical protein